MFSLIPAKTSWQQTTSSLANFSVMFIFKTQIKKNFTTPVVIDVEGEAMLSKSVSKGLKAQSSFVRDGGGDRQIESRIVKHVYVLPLAITALSAF